VVTVKRDSLQVTVRAWTGNKRFGSGTDPTSCFLQDLLECYFGAAANSSFTGTTIAAASGPGKTTPLKVTSASGMSVGLAIRNATTKEVGFITAISGTDITLNRDFTTVTAAIELEGAFNFVPTIGQYGRYPYVNHERASVKRLLGPGDVMTYQLQGLAAGNVLRHVMGLEFNTFTTGINISTKTLNAFTASPLVTKGAEIVVGGSEAVCFYEGGVEFGVRHEWVECADGSQGRDGTIITDTEGAQMTFSEYYDATRWTDYEAQTGKDVLLSFTDENFGAISVWAPNATFKVVPAVNGNKEAQSVTVKFNRPTAAQVAAGITSPFYYAIHSGI
jgi:hypothetical protein